MLSRKMGKDIALSLLYQREDKTAIITINCLEKMNILNLSDVKQLSRMFIDFRDDKEAYVLILTGAGDKAFCAGYDLKEPIPDKFPPLITRGIEIDKPIIAAINGICMGAGLDLSLACDLRLASENASFADPGVKFGMMSAWGGTQRLPRLVKPGIAAEILLMARTIDASEAYRIGLINKVVPSAELMPIAKAWAQQLYKLDPIVFEAIRNTPVGNCGSLNHGHLPHLQ